MIRAVLVAAAVGAAGGAGIPLRLPDPLVGSWDAWAAAGQAVAGLALALIATRGSRRSLVAAPFPVVAVAVTHDLLGPNLIQGIQVVP